MNATDQVSRPMGAQADGGHLDDPTLLQRKAVESLIAGRLRDAVDARQQSGIEEIWQEDEDSYNGIDSVTIASNVNPASIASREKRGAVDPKQSTRSRVYLNITKPKTDVGVARVQEMLIPHDDKPWEIGPTPIPEFKKAANGQDPRHIQLSDGTLAPAQDVAKALMFKAEQASELMEAQIEDWFVEGSVYQQLRKVIRDAGRVGTGCIKGPTPCYRKDKKWDLQGDVAILQSVNRLAPHAVAKSIWDIFPDPSCGEVIHDGAFLFERDYLTGRRLRELAELPEYDKQGIVDCLKEGPKKRTRYDDRQYRENEGQVPTFESDTFEVWYYYGDIPPEDLISGGFVIKGFNDAEQQPELVAQLEQALQLTTVSIVATMVNERIVRVSLNPLETGDFPFDLFCWEPVDGQPWGRGIPRKMNTAQKMLNASTRALLENAGMSAGPQIVIDKTRIEPANGVYEIAGRKLWYWTPGDEVKDVRFAFASVVIPSAQAELQAIIEFSLRMADELSNMPLLLQGIAGSGAPETLGGQAMAESNATSPLKSIAKQFDDQIIVRMLRRFHAWAMQDPNVSKEAKDGDQECRARGATALIYRDAGAQFLPQIANLLENPKFKINPEKWLAEVLRGNKVNPTAIQYTDEEAKAIEDAAAQNPPPEDPRIAAAKINAEAKSAAIQADAQKSQAKLEQDARENQADRDAELVIKSIEREIQVMEFAGNKQMSLEQLRGLLASKAMEIRNKRELFAAERNFAETAGHGRGL